MRLNRLLKSSNTDWEHPLFTSYTTPIVLQAGEGLTSEVTYFNNTGKTVNFGLTSDDEMNIILGISIEEKVLGFLQINICMRLLKFSIARK